MNVNVSYNGFSLADAASCVMMRLPVPDLVWDMEVLWKVWNEPIPAITPEVLPEPLPEVPAVKSKKPVGCHRAVTYAGKEYPDVKSLAEAYHLNYKTCFARLRDGLPLDAPINRHPLPYRGKPVTIDGREYPSVKDASKALGIPYTTLFTRIRKGQDLSMPKYADRCEPITYQGKEYPSVEALSRATGINSRSWLYRIRHNIPLDAPWGKGGNKRRKDELEKPAVPASEPEPKPGNTEAVRQTVTALPPKSNRYADEGNGRRLKNCPCELDGRQYTSLDTMAVILDITDGEAYRQVMKRGKFLKKGVK